MEIVNRVTLGVVGDSGVGKTLLCLSYTANHVLKDYKPTVLDHHWTLLKHDDLIVDLQIWDNSGSDEYNSLRPLSYSHTDVFLVCFSLKCLQSLEHVRSVWLPEIEKAVGKRPFILVGCKRDDCVSKRKTLDVLTDEGEKMARELGAVKYVETSAIEQSGFTTCFNSAIKAALDAKQTTDPPGGMLGSRSNTTLAKSQTLKPDRSPLPKRAFSFKFKAALEAKKTKDQPGDVLKSQIRSRSNTTVAKSQTLKPHRSPLLKRANSFNIKAVPEAKQTTDPPEGVLESGISQRSDTTVAKSQTLKPHRSPLLPKRATSFNIKAAPEAKKTTDPPGGVLESGISPRSDTTVAKSQALQPHRSPLPTRDTSRVSYSTLPPNVSLTKYHE